MTTYEEVKSAADALMERAFRWELHLRADEESYGIDNRLKERMERYERLKVELRDEVRQEMSDIPGLFAPLAALPHPDGFKALASRIEEALTWMAGPSGNSDFTDGPTKYAPNEAYDMLNGWSSLMDNWKGTAAQQFSTTYMPKMERVVWNQFAALAALRGALVAEAHHWTKAREDVVHIIDGANVALDAFNDSCDEDAWILFLGIVGAVVSVAAVPFTGGTSAELGWAAASSAVAAAGSIIGKPDEVPETELSASSPGEVIERVRAAVASFKEQLIKNEDFIAQCCDEVAKVLHGDEYVIPRPALADSDNVRDGANMGEPS